MVTRTRSRWQTPAWKRDLATAFTRVPDLLAFLDLDPGLADGAAGVARTFPVLVPQGYAALMEPGNPTDPLLRQVLPVAEEARTAAGFSTDPVGDNDAAVAPGLLQKYAGRALYLAAATCAVNCRYCFRRHFRFDDGPPAAARREAALAALAGDPSIHEVILSGGDPLMLDDPVLDRLIGRLEGIGHLRRLRLHTRLPVVLPRRITPILCERLAASRLQGVVVIHANHPAELGAAAATALARLDAHRLPLLNQSVLLHGVNDDAETLAALAERLFELRVHNYYLHMLDPVAGAAHFAVTEERAIALIMELRRRLPGYLVPRLVREVPGAPHKMPVA